MRRPARPVAVKKKKLATGALTFLFSDIEGSTVRWERLGAAMTRAVQRHDEIMRAAIDACGGHIFKTIGDAFCAAFSSPADAMTAALAAQRQLAAEDFAAVDGLRVRMAIHSGIADQRGGDYFGAALNRVARILSIVHGGQVVLSDLTSDLVRATLPPDTSLLDLGSHRLKDLGESHRLYQLVVADLPSEFPMLRSLELLPNNLPLQLSRFIGRDDELATTKSLLQGSRLVTLVGAGGIGKTRLALQVGGELLDTSADGVWFIELAPVRDPDQVPSAVAMVLGVKESAERSLTESLANFLRRKKLLLILDNCEHLVEAAAALASAILHECPEVRILATSRQPLGVKGEHPHRVSSLAVPPEHGTLSKEEALRYGAIALFADHARIATESFELTDDNAVVVTKICRRLDGIALALELAAPRLKMLTLDQLDERLSERFRVLTGGSRDALPRQQTMHALIDWSYDLLDEDEQRLFRQLCVFAGDFSPEAAAAVAADETRDEWRCFELLSSLVDKSLVTSELVDSQRRYGLLESMREYALEKASTSDDVNALRLRHAEYYTSLAERGSATYTNAGNRSEWLRGIEPEREQFLAVLGWALDARENPDVGARLLTAIRKFFLERGFATAVSRWAEAALALDLTPSLQAALWLTLAESQGDLLVPRRQLQAASRARQLYEALDDRTGLARALRQQGMAQILLGALAEADETLHSALALFREQGDQRGIGLALTSLGYCLMKGGRLAEARAVMLEALELSRALGDERGVLVTLDQIAEVEFQLGEVESAVAHGREVLENETARADSGLLASQKSNLAAYLFALDRFDEGRREALETLKIAGEGEYHVYAAWALQHLAAMIAQADPNRAGQLLGYVESVFTASGYTRWYTERYTYDRLMTTLRETLSEDEIATLLREGGSLTEDQAVELAQAAASDEVGGKV